MMKSTQLQVRRRRRRALPVPAELRADHRDVLAAVVATIAAIDSCTVQHA